MKKKLIILLAIGIIALVTIFGLTRNKQSTTISSVEDLLAPPVAADYYEDTNRIEVDSGSVTIIRSTGEEEVITDESNVGVGDTIIVGEESEATLYWFDDSISRLSAGTEITIDTADYNPENINETDIGFEVVSGEVWSKVQNLVDKDSEFLSYSGDIVAGVRGSTYNHKVSNGKISVSSIMHAAYVENKNGERQTIVSGEKAMMDEEGSTNIEVENILPETMNGKWFRENFIQDKNDEKKIMRKKLDRLKKKIGPLPGESGFDDKQKLLEEKLNSATAPVEKAEIRERIALIKTQEALFQMASKKINNDTFEQFKRAQKRIFDGDMPEKMKVKMLNELKQQIINADRILNVGPNEKNLYEAKDALRNLRMEWEDNPQQREWMRNRITEMRLYEMYDWAKYYGFDPEQFEILAKRFFLDASALPDFINSHPEYKILAARMMIELEGKPINLEQLQLLKEQFQLTEREIQVIKEVIRNPDTINLLDIQPEPTPEIIKEAPYYQGASLM